MIYSTQISILTVKEIVIQGVQAHVLLAVFFVTLELTALYFILISNYVPYIMQF